MGKVRTPGGLEVDVDVYRRLFAAVRKASEHRKAVIARRPKNIANHLKRIDDLALADAALNAALSALDAYCRAL